MKPEGFNLLDVGIEDIDGRIWHDDKTGEDMVAIAFYLDEKVLCKYSGRTGGCLVVKKALPVTIGDFIETIRLASSHGEPLQLPHS